MSEGKEMVKRFQGGEWLGCLVGGVLGVVGVCWSRVGGAGKIDGRW